MKKLIVAIVIGVAFSFGIYWQMHMKHSTHGGSSEHAHQDSKEETKTLYICPMHPQITSDKPGQTCSICGMDLVPASDFEEDEEHDHDEHSAAMDGENSSPDTHAGVKISTKKQQMIGIKLARVKKEKLFKSINAPGRIAFDPELYTAQSEYLEALKQWRRVKESPLSDVRKSTSEMIKSVSFRRILTLAVRVSGLIT